MREEVIISKEIDTAEEKIDGSKLKEKGAESVVFYQIMTVIILLTIAIFFKSFGGELFERCRLKLSNMISDRGGYGDIVYPAGAYDGEGEI